jgi:protein ImuB
LWLHRRRLRQRVLAATGPERILPEWWRPEDGPARPRDYYRVATSDGAFWISRDGRYGDPEPPRWRVRGAFA